MQTLYIVLLVVVAVILLGWIGLQVWRAASGFFLQRIEP